MTPPVRRCRRDLSTSVGILVPPGVRASRSGSTHLTRILVADAPCAGSIDAY
jgi:hypothetical protein